MGFFPILLQICAKNDLRQERSAPRTICAKNDLRQERSAPRAAGRPHHPHEWRAAAANADGRRAGLLCRGRRRRPGSGLARPLFLWLGGEKQRIVFPIANVDFATEIARMSRLCRKQIAGGQIDLNYPTNAPRPRNTWAANARPLAVRKTSVLVGYPLVRLIVTNPRPGSPFRPRSPIHCIYRVIT